MTNLQHWRLLVAVADAANISRAAERVGITQSGASQAIAQVEAALGFQVFTRERRHVGLTALGEQVIDHARAMLLRFEAIRALSDESKGLASKCIRLASFPSVISTVLPPLLREFQRRHPRIELIALEGTDEEVETWLADDTVDLGVVLNPDAERHATILGQDAWVAVLPNNHPLARRSSTQGITLDELAVEPFILATGGCKVNGQSLVEHAGLALSDIRVTVRDWNSACMLVKEGLGVALIPDSALPAEQRGIRVMQLAPPVYRKFGLVCSRTGRSAPAVQFLMESLSVKRRARGISVDPALEAP